jgi:hypothetical protein
MFQGSNSFKSSKTYIGHIKTSYRVCHILASNLTRSKIKNDIKPVPLPSKEGLQLKCGR